MRKYFALIGLLAVSQAGRAQSLTNTNATSIQGKPVKSPLTCNDGFVLTWVAANSRFECLAGGSGGGGGGATSPAGTNTQIQYNNNGAFGASAGFTFASGTHELSLGPGAT